MKCEQNAIGAQRGSDLLSGKACEGFIAEALFELGLKDEQKTPWAFRQGEHQSFQSQEVIKRAYVSSGNGNVL